MGKHIFKRRQGEGVVQETIGPHKNLKELELCENYYSKIYKEHSKC